MMKEVLLDLAKRFMDKLLEKGASEAEFFGSWARVRTAEISDGRIKRISVSDSGKYGIRVAVGKRIASIGLSDLSPDIDKFAETLIKIARNAPEDRGFPGFATNYSRGVLSSTYDEKIAMLEPEAIVGLLKSMINTAGDAGREAGAGETIVTQGGLEVVDGGKLVVNSFGEHLYEENTILSTWLEIKSRRDGGESTFYLEYSSRRLDENEILRETAEAAKLSTRFMGGKPIESGKYEVLLHPHVTAKFLETVLAPAFSALHVQRDRSPLKGKIDKQVLSENIDILDDPSIDWATGSCSFDDEGIPTSRKYVVSRGVLETYLYDHYTASRENKYSTGNGFRRTVSSPPSPSFTNMYVVGRNTMKWEELVDEMKKGIIVYGVIGYWTSNFVNGGAQATVTHGLLVENGEIKGSIKGVVIGGNIYKWLGKDLVGIGDKVVPLGDVHAPAVLIRNVDVAGK